MVNLTSQEKRDFETAESLARSANSAFDRRRRAAERLSIASSAVSSRLDELDPGGIGIKIHNGDTVRADQAGSDFQRANTQFAELEQAATSVMPPREIFEREVEGTEFPS